MKKLIIIILTFVMILNSFSIASSEDIKSWSLLIPFDNNTHTLLNIIMCNGKISVASVEINSELNGYPYAVNNGVLEIEMEDGIHKAQIVDDHLFYQLLPDSYTVMLDHVEDFDPVFLPQTVLLILMLCQSLIVSKTRKLKQINKESLLRFHQVCTLPERISLLEFIVLSLSTNLNRLMLDFMKYGESN